jgi:hypothetical protein
MAIKNTVKKFILFIICNILLFHLIGYINYKATLNEIKSGRIIYANELGWVSRVHATATGPKQFLTRYIKKDIKINDTISYAQFLGEGISSKKIYIKVEKKYIVTENLSQIDKEILLFCIFKDVTAAYENFQGKIPYYFFTPSYSSSFANGDLTGNLISYYCAYHQIDETNFINQLTLQPFSDTLKQSLRKNTNTNKEWILPFYKGDIVDFYNKNNDFNWKKKVKEVNSSINIQTNTKY